MGQSCTKGKGRRGVRVEHIRELAGVYDRRRLHALAIGVDEYLHWKKLKCARGDAVQFAATLATACGFPADPEHMRLRLDHEFSSSQDPPLPNGFRADWGKATRSQLIEDLDHYCRVLTEADSLVIYFAGHGWEHPESERGYWIPVDAHEENISEYVGTSEILDFVAGMKARHVLIICDSCFAGGLFRGPPEETEERMPTYYRVAFSKPSRVGFTSGDDHPVPDGEMGHSRFNRLLCSALQYDPRGLLTPRDVWHGLKVPLAEIGAGQFSRCEPIGDARDLGGSFVFCRRQVASKLMEDTCWDRANASGSIASYQYYLDLYPRGRYRSEALARKRFCESDEAAWKSAHAEGTVLACEVYLADFPNGKFGDDAKARIRLLGTKANSRKWPLTFVVLALALAGVANLLSWIEPLAVRLARRNSQTWLPWRAPAAFDLPVAMNRPAVLGEESPLWGGVVPEVARRLTDVEYLRKQLSAQSGGVLALIAEYDRAIEVLPEESPVRDILVLLRRSIGRHVSFLEEHPDLLFQCLWNDCWWYDSPVAVEYLRANGVVDEEMPWVNGERPRLFELVETWRSRRGPTPWLRCLVPPLPHLSVPLERQCWGGYGEAISSFGERMVVAAKGEWGKTVTFWDAWTGEVLYTPEIRTDSEICCVAFSAGGCTLAVGTHDGRIEAWDWSDRGFLGSLSLPAGVTVAVLAYSNDEEKLAAGCSDGVVRVFSAVDEGPALELRGLGEEVSAAAFSPDGTKLIACSAGRAIVWNIFCNKEAFRLTVDETSIQSVGFSPAGRYFAIGTSGSSLVHTQSHIVLWDSEEGKEVARRSCADGAVRDLAFTQDGKRIVYYAARGYLYTMDVDGWVEVDRLRCWGDVRRIALSEDGTYCFGTTYPGGALAWQLSESRDVMKRGVNVGSGSLQTFALAGSFCCGTVDNAVRVWNLTNGKQLCLLDGCPGSVSSLCFSADGRRIAGLCPSDSGAVRLWDVPTGRQLHVLKEKEGECHVRGVVFVPDGKMLVTTSQRGMGVWDVDLGVCLGVFAQPVAAGGRGYWGTAIAPDGKTGASFCQGGLLLWDVERRTRMCEPIECMGQTVGFAPDSEQFVVLLRNNECLIPALFDAATGQLVRRFDRAPGYWVDEFSFSPSGERIFGWSRGGVIIWQVETGEVISGGDVDGTIDPPPVQAPYSVFDADFFAGMRRSGEGVVWFSPTYPRTLSAGSYLSFPGGLLKLEVGEGGEDEGISRQRSNSRISQELPFRMTSIPIR